MKEIRLQERTKTNGSLLRVGDLAQRAGRTVRTIHYYEELGLITPTGHTSGGFRLYDENTLNRIRSIEMFQEMGMSLAHIQSLTKIWNGSPTGLEASKKLIPILRDWLSQTESLLERLTTVKDELEHTIEQIESCQPCSVKPDKWVCHECIQNIEAHPVSALIEFVISSK
ncbi:MAG: MerR family transcriptional regulator [Armatimonadetes bacterium]|nr:MerR family transcriptional regulator [Armatimonadota bacterium]